MLIGCSAGVLLIVILYLSTIPYKRAFRRTINKRIHKLSKIYGLSMFLADRIPKKLLYKNSKINTAIKELTVRENIQKEKYLYIVQKLSISIVVLIISLLLGLAISLSEKIQDSGQIKEITRDRSKITTYQFVAENESGQIETIQVDVNSKELTTDDIYELMNQMEEPLVKKYLGIMKVWKG